MSAKQRSKLLIVAAPPTSSSAAAAAAGSSEDPAAATAADAATIRGSLEYTYARLQQYSSWLEARMVARFDRALQVEGRGGGSSTARG